jgi:hypothetical protein
LSDANRRRDWRIYADFAHVLEPVRNLVSASRSR